MYNISGRSLYLVITPEYGLGRPVLQIAKNAILGGVDIIQLRQKGKPKEEVIKLAKELKQLCRENKVVFIVNDDPQIAKESQADGVHLGQEDILKCGIKEARGIIGADKIIGISTHSLAQLRAANNADVDYIAFGPIFATKTKDYFIGTKDIKEALRIAKKPLFFIGGINLSNLEQVLHKGAKNIAVIRGIMQADNVRETARLFKESCSPPWPSPQETVPNGENILMYGGRNGRCIKNR